MILPRPVHYQRTEEDCLAPVSRREEQTTRRGRVGDARAILIRQRSLCPSMDKYTSSRNRNHTIPVTNKGPREEASLVEDGVSVY